VPRTVGTLLKSKATVRAAGWTGAFALCSTATIAGVLALAPSPSLPVAYHSGGQVLATTGISQSDKIIGAVLVSLLVTVVALRVVRRHQRERALETSRSILEASLSRLYAPVIPPEEAGWVRVGTNPNEQGYWDGHAWTAQRHWTGAGWVIETSGEGRRRHAHRAA
jgi:hypothetical protein